MATMPPLRRLERAATTTAPLGAKVMARSSWTGGLSFSLPTQVAPRAAARAAVGFAAGADVDFAVPGLEDGDGEAGGAAEAEEADAFAGLDAGDAEAAEADDARAEERGDVDVVETGGEGIDEVGAGQGVFGIAAIDGVAGKDGVVAEVFFAAAAEGASAVGAADPGDADARADWKVGGCALDDFADDLVAGDEAWVERGQVAFDDVEVGAADSAGEDAEEDVAGGERRTGHLHNA